MAFYFWILKQTKDNFFWCLLSDIVSDGFLLATDSFLHAIVQISIDTSRLEYTALDLGSMTNPIAVDYDPIEDRVYWSDVKEQKVQRAFMNGTGKEVITTPGYGIRGEFILFGTCMHTLL